MDKARIKLVTIGHMPPHLNFNWAATWKSEIFELVDQVENFALRCDSDSYDWVFSDALLQTQLPALADADFLIAIVNVPIAAVGGSIARLTFRFWPSAACLKKPEFDSTERHN